MGIVLGCLAVPAYLAYKGEKPINVMVVFFGLIVLPWVITGTSLYLSSWLRGDSSKGGVGAGVAYLISRLSPEWRESWNDLRRVLQEHGKRIVPILAGLFFGFTQRIACGFGLGALLSILFHVTVFDLAFGWESTLSVGAEFMCFFVNVISAPWSWFWTASVPSLEQVRESTVLISRRYGGSKCERYTVVVAVYCWQPECSMLSFHGFSLLYMPAGKPRGDCPHSTSLVPKTLR